MGKLNQVSYFLITLIAGESSDLREVREEDFISFAHFLKGKELKEGTIAQYLSGVRAFFIWLFKNDLILSPLAELIPSVKAISKEKAIFTSKEINQFLDSIDSHLRDRVFFELLYSSGLRCSEALNLKWKDVFMKTRKLRVEQGKGGYDRFVPFCNSAAFFLKKWKSTERSRSLART